MENEIWKVWKDTRSHVKGHLYEVSNQGRAKVDGVIFEFKEDETHYYRLPCHDHLHRAVGILFVPNPDNKPCIDHINGDKHDNRACNLRWCTPKENSNNPVTIIRMQEHAKTDEFISRMQQFNAERWSLQENHDAASKVMKDYWDSELGSKRREAGFNYIHLNGVTKIVSDEYLDYWLDDGWLYGRGPIKQVIHKDWKWMHLNGQTLQVNKEDQQKYIDNGWSFGREKFR